MWLRESSAPPAAGPRDLAVSVFPASPERGQRGRLGAAGGGGGATYQARARWLSRVAARVRNAGAPTAEPTGLQLLVARRPAKLRMRAPPLRVL